MQEPRVLIVEHDDRVCRVLSRIFKRMGYEAFPAIDYEGFKNLYAEKTPAIILLDMEIPGHDSTDFFRYLVEQHSPAAVVLLSDLEENETSEFLELGKSAGLNMGDILRKPVDVEAVKQLLGGEYPETQDSPLKKSQKNRQSLQVIDRVMILDPDHVQRDRFRLSFDINYVF